MVGCLKNNVFTFGCAATPVFAWNRLTSLGTVTEAKIYQVRYARVPKKIHNKVSSDSFKGFSLDLTSPYNKYRTSNDGRFMAIFDNRNVGVIDVTFDQKKMYEFSDNVEARVVCVDFLFSKLFLFSYDSSKGFVEIKYQTTGDRRSVKRYNSKPLTSVDKCTLVDAECLSRLGSEETHFLLVTGCPRESRDSSNWCHYGVHKFVLARYSQGGTELLGNGETYSLNGQILGVKPVDKYFLIMLLGYEEELLQFKKGKVSDIECHKVNKVFVRLNEIRVLRVDPRTGEIIFLNVMGHFHDVNHIRVDYLLSIGMFQMWRLASVNEFYGTCRKIAENRWAANNQAVVFYCKGKLSWALLNHPGVRGKLMRRKMIINCNTFPAVDLHEFQQRQCRITAVRDGFIFHHQKEKNLHFVSLLPKLSIRSEKDEPPCQFRISQVNQYTDNIYEDY